MRVRRERNEACPGEDTCTEGGRIFDERRRTGRPELPIVQICAACPLLPTKQSLHPPEMSYWTSTALRLERLKEAGAVYAYPDALTVGEWAALDALKIARAEAEDESAKERAAQQSEQAAIARLEALQRRR